jgi:hypothetical protein
MERVSLTAARSFVFRCCARRARRWTLILLRQLCVSTCTSDTISILPIMTQEIESKYSDAPFINRQADLRILDEFHARRGAQFMVVYGRRRIGKTALLNHWLNGRSDVRAPLGFYWVAHRATAGIC